MGGKLGARERETIEKREENRPVTESNRLSERERSSLLRRPAHPMPDLVSRAQAQQGGGCFVGDDRGRWELGGVAVAGLPPVGSPPVGSPPPAGCRGGGCKLLRREEVGTSGCNVASWILVGLGTSGLGLILNCVAGLGITGLGFPSIKKTGLGWASPIDGSL